MMKLQWSRVEGGNYVAYPDEQTTFELQWQPYGKSRKTWYVLRDGHRLSLAFYSRLKDAEDRAQREYDKARP